MALSQVYLEWEKQTKRLGLEQGVQQGREQGYSKECNRAWRRNVGRRSRICFDYALVLVSMQQSTKISRRSSQIS
jgi:hypothetical protein